MRVSLTQSERLGNTEPRFYTPQLSDLTLGPEAVRFAREVLGLTLYPWQEWLLDRSLELAKPWDNYTEPPPWRYRTVIVLVARQNGKTLMLQVRALAGLFLWCEQLAISLAQARHIAFEPWRLSALWAETKPALRNETKAIHWANGKEAIELKNGARWLVVAANQGGRGLSADTVFMDELRQQDSWNVWGAIDKTRSAKDFSQLWGFSNAGTDSSLVLNEFVTRGRALSSDPRPNESFGYFEWSAPEDADPSSPEVWAMANPSLGYKIKPQTIEAELATDPMPEFLTERLCVRVTVMSRWLPQDLWDGCADPTAVIPEGAPLSFSVDSTPDASMVIVALAAPTGEGVINVELIQAIQDTAHESAGARLMGYLPQLLARYPKAECVYDPRGPIAGTCADLARAGLPMRALTAVEVREACGRFYDLVKRKALTHRADALLNEHVGNAIPNPRGGDSWVMSRRSSTAGPITGLIAVVLATQAARDEPPSQAQWVAY